MEHLLSCFITELSSSEQTHRDQAEICPEEGHPLLHSSSSENPSRACGLRSPPPQIQHFQSSLSPGLIYIFIEPLLFIKQSLNIRVPGTVLGGDSISLWNDLTLLCLLIHHFLLFLVLILCPESRDTEILSYSPLYTQCPGQFLAQSKCSINDCWMNYWANKLQVDQRKGSDASFCLMFLFQTNNCVFQMELEFKR